MNRDLLGGLVNTYLNWCCQQGLGPMSADELMHEDITEAQREWLTAFIKLWELSE